MRACGWWFPQGIKRERGAGVNALNAVAAPATVSGEFPSNHATGNGRSWEGGTGTATREPGDLPPVMFTRERVGRGVPMRLNSRQASAAEGDGGMVRRPR